jgi:hypothetical protein
VSEPQAPITPASPWNPTPAATRGRTGPGCSKPLLIGCGVLLLVLGIGAVVFLVRMPSIVQWWFQKLEGVLEAHLPTDVTAPEKARYHAAFVSARRSLASGRVDASRMQPFQSRLLSISGSEKAMTHQQLYDLTVSLEQLAGQHPQAPPVPPSPPPASGPTGPSPPR